MDSRLPCPGCSHTFARQVDLDTHMSLWCHGSAQKEPQSNGPARFERIVLPAQILVSAPQVRTTTWSKSRIPPCPPTLRMYSRKTTTSNTSPSNGAPQRITSLLPPLREARHFQPLTTRLKLKYLNSVTTSRSTFMNNFKRAKLTTAANSKLRKIQLKDPLDLKDYSPAPSLASTSIFLPELPVTIIEDKNQNNNTQNIDNNNDKNQNSKKTQNSSRRIEILFEPLNKIYEDIRKEFITESDLISRKIGWNYPTEVGVADQELEVDDDVDHLEIIYKEPTPSETTGIWDSVDNDSIDEYCSFAPHGRDTYDRIMDYLKYGNSCNSSTTVGTVGTNQDEGSSQPSELTASPLLLSPTDSHERNQILIEKDLEHVGSNSRKRKYSGLDGSLPYSGYDDEEPQFLKLSTSKTGISQIEYLDEEDEEAEIDEGSESSEGDDDCHDFGILVSCFICEKKVSDISSHLKLHKVAGGYICLDCNYVFTSADSVHPERHICRVRVPRGEKKIHDCEHCEKQFNRASLLESHLRTHSGEKPYVCHLCLTRFTQSSSMNRHMRKMHNYQIQPRRRQNS